MLPTYTISLSLDQLRVISAALQELPYRISKPVLDHMAAQTDAQDAEARQMPPAAEEVSQ